MPADLFDQLGFIGIISFRLGGPIDLDDRTSGIRYIAGLIITKEHIDPVLWRPGDTLDRISHRIDQLLFLIIVYRTAPVYGYDRHKFSSQASEFSVLLSFYPIREDNFLAIE